MMKIADITVMQKAFVNPLREFNKSVSAGVPHCWRFVCEYESKYII